MSRPVCNPPAVALATAVEAAPLPESGHAVARGSRGASICCNWSATHPRMHLRPRRRQFHHRRVARVVTITSSGATVGRDWSAAHLRSNLQPQRRPLRCQRVATQEQEGVAEPPFVATSPQPTQSCTCNREQGGSIKGESARALKIFSSSYGLQNVNETDFLVPMMS